MRYSLKWGLMGMAYVALAAAAFGQGHWAYADLLWLATFGAICLAVVTAVVGAGARRAGAAGFALFALALAICAQVAPESVPTRRILLASGVSPYDYPQGSSPWYAPPLAATATFSAPTVTVYAPNAPVPPTAAPTPVPVAFPVPPIESSFTSKLRAANSLGAMLAGIAGCWVGVAAFRRQQGKTGVRGLEATEPNMEMTKNRRLDNRPVAT